MAPEPGTFGYPEPAPKDPAGTRRKRRYMGAVTLVLMGCGFGLVWPSTIRLIRFHMDWGAWDVLAVLACPALIWLGFVLVPSTFRGKWRRKGPYVATLALAAGCIGFGSLIAWAFGFFYLSQNAG